MSGAKKKMERRASLAEAGMTEREKRELKEQQAKRRNTILATVGGVVVVVLVILLLVWHSGLFGRLSGALTVGEHELSVADMDYYYYQAVNNAYSYEQQMASFYSQNGLGDYTPSFDPSVSLKTQYVDAEQTQSYHDYFLDQAKTNAIQTLALSDAAKAAGYTLSETAQESLDSMGSELDAQLKQSYYASRDAYLKALYGRSMTESIYFKNLELSVLASDYYSTQIETMGGYSDEELTAYFNEHTSELSSYDYDYVYFDGTAQPTSDADGNQVAATEEESAAALADAKAKAEALLAMVKAANGAEPAEGEAEPQTFSALAESQGATATARTAQLGSECSSMPYSEWLMDASRQDGDVDLFELEGTGYYVVQFHKSYMNDDPAVDARHILAAFQADETTEHDHDENGQHVYTDAEKAAAKEKAESYLAEYNAGEHTAEAFGALAEKYSDDGRDAEGALNAAGGLYEGIARGDMVQPFEDWCFDPSRQEGDTGLVETTYGWHVMYFQGFHRPTWMDQAESAKKTAEQEAFLEDAQAGYEAVEGSGWSNVGSR